MTKKLLSVILALNLAVLSFTACGSKDGQSSNDANSGTSASSGSDSGSGDDGGTSEDVSGNDDGQDSEEDGSSEDGDTSGDDDLSSGADGTTSSGSKTTAASGDDSSDGGKTGSSTTKKDTSSGSGSGSGTGSGSGSGSGASGGTATTTAKSGSSSGTGSSGSSKTTTATSSSGTSTSSGTSVSSTTLSGTSKNMKYAESHDPSIVKGYVQSSVSSVSGSTVVKGVKDSTYNKEVYFIFGSHLAFAYSFDLQTWTKFTNNINTSYNTLFKEAFDWSKKGDTAYATSGNMWAPDVIYNTSMGKWCMYMSINGCSWNSSIVLLTADSLAGSWTYVGPVVYSGFCNDSVRSYKDTDYVKATGESSLASRYTRSSYVCKDGTTNCTATTWSNSYGAHAIDPCVIYDDSGDLWMSYGSWSGGIWMFKLDKKTGLRDYNTKYSYSAGSTDPYMGYLLAGGSGKTGEASYIQKIGKYYYLFVSYGGLVANGGYSMRVFRSSKVNGPYTDITGDAATKVSTNVAGAVTGTVGELLMFNYKWSYMNQGFVAQGHNSAFVDDDGRAYVIYHTRFSNRGEGHQVRVHQLFSTESGWLTAAPFSYSGEKLAKVTASDVAGTYETLFLETTDYANKECNTNTALEFNSNGTVSGAKSGTWKFSSTLGSPYVTVTLGGQTLEGVFVKQKKEVAAAVTTNPWANTTVGDEVMCFTLINKSSERSVWGYKLDLDNSSTVTTDMNALTLPTSTVFGITLPTTGSTGSSITWKSSNTSIMSNAGKVTASSSPSSATKVTLTATFKSGSVSKTKNYTVTVEPYVSGSVSTSSYPFFEDFTSVWADGVSYALASSASVAGKWYSQYAADLLNVAYNKSDSHGLRLNFNMGSGVSGPRAASYKFESKYCYKPSYTVEADVQLKCTDSSRPSQFVITSSTGSTVYNAAYTGDYILKLSAEGDGKVKINDTSTTASFPADSWVHVIATVSADGSVTAKIGSTTVNTTVKGSSTTLGGLTIVACRNNGCYVNVDNIAVKQ